MCCRCPSVSSGHPTCLARSIQHPSAGGAYVSTLGVEAGAVVGVGVAIVVVVGGSTVSVVVGSGVVVAGLAVVVGVVEPLADCSLTMMIVQILRTVIPMMMATSIRLVILVGAFQLDGYVSSYWVCPC